ncbi:MAG: HD domain-containing phosphohydrolase [Candidatus Edwardsbacteria bacterium]
MTLIKKKQNSRKKTTRTAPRKILKESSETNIATQLVNLKMKVKILQRINEIASSTMNINAVMDKVMDLIEEIAACQASSLLLVEPEKRTLRFVVVKGEASEGLKDAHLVLGEGIAGWVAKTGIPLIVNDVTKEPRWKKEFAEKLGFATHNILCVPLKLKENVMGVIELINKVQKQDFTEEDLEIIELLSSHLATLIENARLYGEMREKMNRIQTLVETSAIISSSLDLNRVLQSVMDEAKNVIGAEASSIFRIDEETKELYFEVATGEKGEEVKKIRVPWGKGIVGAVAEKGQTELVSDVTKDPRWFGRVDKKSGFVTRSILAVPLKVKDKVIGVAQVLNKIGEGTFTKDDVELFEGLARQAAIAVENARLYQDLQELFVNSIKTVVSLIDAKDEYTAGHSERVTKYSLMIAKEMGYEEDDLKRLELAGVLHDVGKIGMPDSILKKPDKLTDEEFAIVKQHPARGAEAMVPIKQMKEMIPAIRHHHERYDGGGYPDHLKNNNISQDARIICVADAYDAMTSDRPYRKGLSREEAISRLKKDTTTQFDPEAVEAFCRAMEKG